MKVIWLPDGVLFINVSTDDMTVFLIFVIQEAHSVVLQMA